MNRVSNNFRGEIMKKLIVAMMLGVLSSVALAENCDDCKKLSLKPLDLSRTPTHEELIQSGQLGGPLSPTGPEANSTEPDRLLFGQAMDVWNRHDYKNALPLLKKHAKQFPNSPWRDEAELHLGCEARFNGRYAEAEDYFKGIIADNEKAGRSLADNSNFSEVARKARLRMGMLEFLRGNFDESERIWTEIIETDTDRRRVDYARHWLKRTDLFRANAGESRRCAVESLSRLAQVAGRPETTENLRGVLAHPDYGFRADELIALAKTQGVELSGVQAKRVKDLPTPFIAHYRFKHFVTVTAKDSKGNITVFDPILNLETTMTEKDFAREWSGFALVPSGKVENRNALLSLLGFGNRFEVVSGSELSAFAGGCCGVENVNQDEGNPGTLVGGPCGGGQKLCTWAFNPVSMNLFVWDTPIWYQPAIGPAIEFTMSYNGIDADNNLLSFGPKWFLNYHSYCIETPATLAGSVTVFMSDGGNDVYSSGAVTNTYTPPARIFNKLLKTGTNSFTLKSPDGKVYEYTKPQGATNVQQALLSRIVDRHSNTVTILYDGQPNPKLIGVVDALSFTSRVFYAADGMITNIVDPFGRSASVTYSNGYVATVTDMGGVQSVYSFAAAGSYKDSVQSLRTVDGEVTFVFTNIWKREKITATYEDGTTEILYYNGGEASPLSTLYTDRGGYQTRYALKLNVAFPYQGAVDYVINPDGSRVSYKYNASLQATNIIDEVGKTWTFGFNTNGRLTRILAPNNYQSDFTYMPNGFDLATVSEAGQQVLAVGYTDKRDIATATNALNQATQFAYDQYGRLTNITDALTLSTTYEYGPDFRLSQVKRAGVTLATYSFDDKGRVTNAIGPEGIVTAYEYDALDRLTGLTLPGEQPYRWQYETNSLNLSKTLDRTGRRTLLTYNDVNELTQVTAHDGSFSKFEYNGNGQLTTLTDAEANRTRFSYDSRGRLTQKTYAEGDGVQIGYSSNNLIQSFTSGRGYITSFKNDPAGLLTNLNYSATNTPGVRFSFNSRNQLSWSADCWSTNSYFYDNASRLTNLVEKQGIATQQWAYGYDVLSRLTGITWRITGNTNVFTTLYYYDALGRMTNIASGAGTFGYSYTNAGLQISRLSFPNGETVSYSYDSLARMTNLAYSVGGAWSYSYNSRDQVTRRVDSATNVYTYSYDDQGRLIEATGLKGTNRVTGYPFAYTYDRVGNRVKQSENRYQRTLTYNDNNQLVFYERPKSAHVRGYLNEYTTNVVVKSNTATHWIPATVRFLSSTQCDYEADVAITNSGTNNLIYVRATDKNGNVNTGTVRVSTTPASFTYFYDADGNQLSLHITTTNSFDAENRLIHIAYSDGYTRMKYDGFNRLREVLEYDSDGIRTSCIRYVWNGWTPWAQLNSTNGVVRTFTWGVDLSGSIGGAAGIGGLLAIRQGGTNYYVRSDGKGNVTEVRTTNGTLAAAYTYAPFGALLTQTNTYNQPFRFQTKLYHARSGFSYFGARWYDPTTGGWLSRDPSGEGSGINVYQYCFASPLNYVDALGLYGEDVHFNRTFIWAMQAGIDQKTALEIATANNSLDSGDTDPTQPSLGKDALAARSLHFQQYEGHENRAGIFANSKCAAHAGDAQAFGRMLHIFQDTYAHEGYGPKLGHARSGTSPDKYSARSARETAMRARTLDLFKEWKQWNP